MLRRIAFLLFVLVCGLANVHSVDVRRSHARDPYLVPAEMSNQIRFVPRQQPQESQDEPRFVELRSRKGIFDSIRSAVSSVGSSISSAASTAWDGIEDAAEYVGDKASGAYHAASPWVSNAAGTMGRGMMTAGHAIQTGAERAAAGMVDFYDQASPFVSSAASTMGRGMMTAGRAIRTGAERTYDVMGDAYDASRPYLSQAGRAIRTGAERTAAGLSDAYDASRPYLNQAARGVMQGAQTAGRYVRDNAPGALNAAGRGIRAAGETSWEMMREGANSAASSYQSTNEWLAQQQRQNMRRIPRQQTGGFTIAGPGSSSSLWNAGVNLPKPRRQPRPLMRMDEQCVFCQYFTQRLQGIFYSPYPKQPPMVMTPIPIRVNGTNSTTGILPSPPGYPPGVVAMAPPLQWVPGGTVRIGMEVDAHVHAHPTEQPQPQQQQQQKQNVAHEDWLFAEFSSHVKKKETQEPSEKQRHITRHTEESPQPSSPSSSSDWIIAEVHSETHKQEQHQQQKHHMKLQDHLNDKEEHILADVMDLGEKTHKQWESEMEHNAKRVEDWLEAKYIEDVLSATSESSLPRARTRTHWMPAQLLEIGESFSAHVNQHRKDLNRAPLAHPTNHAEDAEIDLRFMDAEVLDQNEYTQQKQQPHKKAGSLLEMQSQARGMGEQILAGGGGGGLAGPAPGPYARPPLIPVPPPPSGRRQQAFDMRTSRPPQMRYGPYPTLGLMNAQQYEQACDWSYSKMEVMCSRRLPAAFAGYCSALLQEFMHITTALRYGERPDEVCIRLDFCPSDSYLNLSPHSVLGVYN